MNTEKEKYKSYILLFGLSDNFSHQQLRSAYSALAHLNHPDVSNSPDSQMRMAIINEAYEFLKTHKIKVEENVKSESVIDKAYEHYKQGFSIMKSAFENYFGENENKQFVGNKTILQTELKKAKAQFAYLINEHNNSNWTSDAIDRICSINKWLT